MTFALITEKGREQRALSWKKGKKTDPKMTIFQVLWYSMTIVLLHFGTVLGKIPINIGGFFPQKNDAWDGSGILPAVQMAIDDINSDVYLLPGYELNLLWNDSQCNAGIALQALFHQIHTEPVKHILLGAGCSLATSPIAETAQHWNLVQVSHSSAAPDLDDRQKYSKLFRVYPSDAITNLPRIVVMKAFGWKRAALLSTSTGSFDMICESRSCFPNAFLNHVLLKAKVHALHLVFHEMMMENMKGRLIKNDFEMIVAEQFTDDPVPSLHNLKAKDARVIIATLFPSSARKVFCMAHRLGMTGPTFTWFLPGWFENQWWLVNDTECTSEEMSSAVDRHLSFEIVSLADSNSTTNVSKTPGEFLEEYKRRTSDGDYGATDFAPFGYDSAWVVAFALNESIRILAESGILLEDFDYSRADIASVIFDSVRNLDFQGITGPIHFNDLGMRMGLCRIKQLIGGQYVSVAVSDEAGVLRYRMGNFTWKTENGIPPRDGPVVIVELRKVAAALMYAMSIIAGFGVIFTIFILVVNITYRDRKTIKMSSPKLNFLVCAGCLLLYVSAIIMGFDDGSASSQISILCVVKSWMLTLGFTLSFGTILSKAWRIFKIFANTKVRKQNISDLVLFTIVGILLLIDVSILLTWTISDPLQESVLNLPKEKSGEDIFTIPQYRICQSKNTYMWLGIVYVYKGLTLLYGALLAWETRKIYINLLNDAKGIAMTIYTMTVLCAIAVPVSIVLQERVDFTYAVIAAIIIFATTIMQVLCFVPKIQIVLTNSVASENVLVNTLIAAQRLPTNARGGLDEIVVLKKNLEQLQMQKETLKAELNRLTNSNTVVSSHNLTSTPNFRGKKQNISTISSQL